MSVNLTTSPNTGCVSHQQLLLGARKLAPKKLRTMFFKDKFCSIKAHAHYSVV